MKSELDFFLLHHRIFLVKNFYQCNGDYFGVKTKYEINYKDRSDSPKFSCDVMIEVVNLFEETGSVFKPTENAIQASCEQIEQVYIKTENPDDEYENNTEFYCPVKCPIDPSEIDENNVTQSRGVTQIQNSSSDPNTWSDDHEQFPLIQEFKTEILDEESEELPELCFLCKKRLKRNHTETELHDPDEEFSEGSLSKYEGPKPAKIPKKSTGKNEVKSKRNRTINEAVIQAALQEIIQDKIKLSSAATVFGIPKSTLFTRLKKVKELPEPQNVSLMMGLKYKEMVNKFASRQIFNMAQEENLVTHLLDFSKINFSLTLHVTRELAYQYAVSIGQKVPKSWETNKTAGKAWAKWFLNRHKEITIRRSESTSLPRKISFTRENVEMFFKNLKDIRIQHFFEASRIFSLDETEISTDPQVSTSTRKSEEIGKYVTTEMGETVTICAFFNATGQSLPPVYLFPRKRYNPEYMEGCIEGSVAFCNGTGSMDTDTFLKTLEHLKTQTVASKDNQILLIFYNHISSHLSLDAMIFCKENGIHMLTLPTHMIHRTKPSDLSVFSSFDTYCASAFDAWMSSGNRVKIHNIARLSVEPLQKCMTAENIKSIFMKSGIYPMDSSKLLSFFETTESAFPSTKDSRTVLGENSEAILTSTFAAAMNATATIFQGESTEKIISQNTI